MKQTRLLSLLLALLLLASSLFGCQSKAPEPVDQPTDGEQQTEPDQQAEQTEEPGISVVYELKARNLDPHTEVQNNYLKAKKYTAVTEEMDGKGDESKPQPILLKWSRKVTGGQISRTETAVISKDEAFSDPIRIESQNSYVELYNVEIGQTFYWYVEGKAGKQIFKSDVATFTTVSTAPRNLGVDGVTNCRDLGGWKTRDGVVLKQGVLFRSANFNNVTADGKKVLLDDLGIKTEIELRLAEGKGSAPSTTESMPGSKVNFVFAPMDDTASNLLTAAVNADSLLKVFEVLGDEKNYPIIFHCNIGTDRTGLIAFLVLGLCGVKEQEIYRDYLFSNFASIGSQRGTGAIDKYLNTIEGTAGSTLADKIENYLLSRGVTAEQIATIRKMMR